MSLPDLLVCCLCKKKLNIKNPAIDTNKDIIIAHTLCLDRARRLRQSRQRIAQLNAEWLFFNECC